MTEDAGRLAAVAERPFVAQRTEHAEEQSEGSRVPIASPRDIVDARQKGRVLAQEMGCTSTQATLVATVISELARNILLYAGHGEMFLQTAAKESMTGIKITARDEGPGIQNIGKAMMNGYSTSGGLGLGLSGVKQIADSFHITSKPGSGVDVELIMWLVRRP